ncbi:serine/threonine protein kinase [Saprospira sp. CCB-QB6]|uniref:protein kinase domain-containing protein n=1 Tax=Saprospira sp. CCB-QB6 TaxID=3023936 RepID=UPI00234B2512|nr:serine/threonine protein kinase [Saprospira sp. CCB-QB6]WCL81502.1 serine/threonine protein kinase [Saprospira sp. CCB-QB6]
MSSNSFYLEKTKERILLAAKPFAHGGEGELYKVRSPRSLVNRVVKLYYPHKLQVEKKAKLRALQAYPPSSLEEQKAIFVWPEELVLDQNKQLRGLLMPFVEGHKLELFCLPKLPSRLGDAFQVYNLGTENSRVLRLCLAFELALGLAHLQAEERYVLVDLKPENILFSAEKQLAFVDLDAMQLEHPDGIEKATVSTPEYSGPEYYGADRPVVFDASWDNFSLAVIIYKLLFGIHPFAATAEGEYVQLASLHQKIEAGLFVHNSAFSFSVIPAPHQVFRDQSLALQEGFKQAFIAGHKHPSFRPAAKDWCYLLWAELGDSDLLERFAGFYPLKWREKGRWLTVSELAGSLELEAKSLDELQAAIRADWARQALLLPTTLPKAVIFPTYLRKEILFALPILVVLGAFLSLIFHWAYGFQKSFSIFPVALALALVGYYKREKLLLQERQAVKIGAIWAELKALNEESEQPPLADKELAYWELEEEKKQLERDYQQRLAELEKERQALVLEERIFAQKREEEAIKEWSNQKNLATPAAIWQKKDAFLNRLWEQFPYPLKGQKSIAGARVHLGELEVEELARLASLSFSADKKEASLVQLQINYENQKAFLEKEERALKSNWAQEELEGNRRLKQLANFKRNYKKKLPSIRPNLDQGLLNELGIESMLALEGVDLEKAEIQFIGGEKRSLAAWAAEKPFLMKELSAWWLELMQRKKAFYAQQKPSNLKRALKDLAKEQKQLQQKYEQEKTALEQADANFFRAEAINLIKLKYSCWRKQLKELEKKLGESALNEQQQKALKKWKKAFLMAQMQYRYDWELLSRQQKALFLPIGFEERMNFEQKDRQQYLEELLASYYQTYGHEKAPKLEAP